MNAGELMLNDWVKLKGTSIYCKVACITPTHVSGTTASGGSFKQAAEKLEPVELCKDTLMRTSFWMVTGKIFRKTARNFAAFEYDTKLQRLEVLIEGSSRQNYHYGVYSLHQLQQLYRHYTQGQELSVDILHNKRSEYNQAHYARSKEPQKVKSDEI